MSKKDFFVSLAVLAAVALAVVALCFIFGGYGLLTGGALFAGLLASSGR